MLVEYIRSDPYNNNYIIVKQIEWPYLEGRVNPPYGTKIPIDRPFDLDDLCTPPYCLVVEWPERLNSSFHFDLHLYFSILPNGTREIKWDKERLA